MSPGERPGEFDLIARYFAPMAGAGGLGLVDDAALLTPPPGCDLVLTKDALVAGVHFFPNDPPETIARKALRVNLSDLAAKGARPLGFLLGLGLPTDWREDWLATFASGLAADSALFGCPLLGGDTVRAGGPLILSITALGSVPAGTMVRRSGGKPGDLLYVSGVIGAAALGLHLIRDGDPPWSRPLSGDARAALISAFHVPQPPVALAEGIRLHASAAMDVSDGLIGDALKLAKASGTGLEIEAARVPLPLPGTPLPTLVAHHRFLLDAVLTGGDDYQVLAAVPPDRASAFERAAQDIALPVTPIGRLTARGVRIHGFAGEDLSFGKPSFGHF